MAQREQHIKEVVMEPGGSRQWPNLPLQHEVQVGAKMLYRANQLQAKSVAENTTLLEDKEL